MKKKKADWEYLTRNQIGNILLVLFCALAMAIGLAINNTNYILFNGFLLIAVTINGK